MNIPVIGVDCSTSPEKVGLARGPKMDGRRVETAAEREGWIWVKRRAEQSSSAASDPPGVA